MFEFIGGFIFNLSMRLWQKILFNFIGVDKAKLVTILCWRQLYVSFQYVRLFTYRIWHVSLWKSHSKHTAKRVFTFTSVQCSDGGMDDRCQKKNCCSHEIIDIFLKQKVVSSRFKIYNLHPTSQIISWNGFHNDHPLCL